mmetsp:Transcript_30054/g.96346  ORF Transcript_30054/g.96346 Transcript_30054/m.96346 type:complete len:293 (+) Transcript_30054:33-911(+)
MDEEPVSPTSVASDDSDDDGPIGKFIFTSGVSTLTKMKDGLARLRHLASAGMARYRGRASPGGHQQWTEHLRVVGIIVMALLALYGISDLFDKLHEQAELEELRLEEAIKAEGWSELMSERNALLEKRGRKDKATIKAEKEYKKVMDWQKRQARMGPGTKAYKRWQENYEREKELKLKAQEKERLMDEKEIRRREAQRRQKDHEEMLKEQDRQLGINDESDERARQITDVELSQVEVARRPKPEPQWKNGRCDGCMGTEIGGCCANDKRVERQAQRMEAKLFPDDDSLAETS